MDAFALAATVLNSEANGVSLEIIDGDLLDTDPVDEVVIAGDIFYERPLAERAMAFLRRAAERGATILIGDPKRTYLPHAARRQVVAYEISVPKALEDADVKRTAGWTLA